jgi:hypothetical protein
VSWQSRGWFELWPGGAIEGAARPQKAPFAFTGKIESQY